MHLDLSTDFLSLIESTLLLLDKKQTIFASHEDLLFFRNQALLLQKERSQLIRQNNHSSQHVETNGSKRAQGVISTKQVITTSGQDATENQNVEGKPTVLKTDSSSGSGITEPPFTPLSKGVKKKFSSFQSLQKIVSKVAPHIPLIPEIPSDKEAQQIANRWKTKNQPAPFTILFGHEPQSHHMFLKEISKTLAVYFGSCKLVEAFKIEQENQWAHFLASEQLKWIIVCDHTLWQLTHLMQFYKEISAQQIKTLGKIPLFLLPDLSLYLKDPLLKKSLWKALSCL